MTKRKAKWTADEEWVLQRKAQAALVERVIEACAGAATRWLQGEGLFYEAARVRRSVQRAGRRASKGETT